MPQNNPANPETLTEIARLKAALRKEGASYVCEPEPEGLWSRHGGKRWQHMSREEREALRARLRSSRS